jgi:enediyne biosynthesis protein CalE5
VESTTTFDPVAYKQMQRTDWRAAATGWRAWHHVLEAETAGQVISHKLVELAALGPGDTVLDIGTGYGEPALPAARAVGSQGRVVATDIAAEMLAFGRERAIQAGLDNIEFVASDADELRFDPDTFDAVLSRQGLQYLPDVPGTLRRLHAFLKREGRLAMAVWGPPDTVQFARSLAVIVHQLKLPPPPPGRPGPFALADASALAGVVAEAGFRDVETGMVTVLYEAASPEDFTQWTRDVAPPIANLVNTQPPEVQEHIWRAVTEAWDPLTTDDGRVRTENTAIWVAATKEAN